MVKRQRRELPKMSVDEMFRALAEAKAIPPSVINVKAYVQQAKSNIRRKLQRQVVTEQAKVKIMKTRLSLGLKLTEQDFVALGDIRRGINVSRAQLGIKPKHNWEDVYPKERKN